ncbi:hypothetical protein GCM10022215_11460 [Nocardioides fonticola]|uniref:Uncharacterized protein n=1 Tax=Nocardioides fonticola TaxID=450363 RepID=A0ABP7XFC8_9ACTN
MTATRRPASESTTSTPASDTLWTTTFAALSPLRRDAIAGFLHGATPAADARRLGRTERDVLALRDSSLACWATLAADAGARGPLERLGRGAAALRRGDRRFLLRAGAVAAPVVGTAASAAAGTADARDRRRGVLIAVAVTGAVSLAGVLAAVVVHESPEVAPTAAAAPVDSDGTTADTAPGDPASEPASEPATDPASDPAAGDAADGADLLRVGPVVAGALLLPADPVGPAGASDGGSDAPSGEGDPGEASGGDGTGDPGAGDPDTPPSEDPGVSVETDPGSGRVRIVVRVPGADPIVIETPALRG